MAALKLGAMGMTCSFAVENDSVDSIWTSVLPVQILVCRGWQKGNGFPIQAGHGEQAGALRAASVDNHSTEQVDGRRELCCGSDRQANLKITYGC